ncbi:hypothetical protein HK104_005921, partial [Borealophlyctis nickersoniae]
EVTRKHMQNKADKLNYNVKRTKPAGWLPVYRSKKYAGTLILTTITRIEGHIEQLAKDLESFIPKDRITIRPLQQHIVLKGDYLDYVRDWLTARKF